MASSTSTTKDIANAWATFYTQYRKLPAGVVHGPRAKKIEAARKEWSEILNDLRGGNLRHWPTEPDEIRQIQELLNWRQSDMWSAIDGTAGVSAHRHIRGSGTQSTAYPSFQGWASEVKERWDAQKNTAGAKTRSSSSAGIQTHGPAKPKADGANGHLLGLSHPFLVPFAPLYEELNGSLDSEERKHFAVIKSVERQSEFYSMAYEYTANVQNELKEVDDALGRKEIYQRYASSLLILATKSYDEWTKDVMDWKAPTDDEDEGSDDEDSDDEDDDNEDETEDDEEDDEDEGDEDGDEDEGEANSHTDSIRINNLEEVCPLYSLKSSEDLTVKKKVAPHSTNNNDAGMGNRNRDSDHLGAKTDFETKYTITPSTFGSLNMNGVPFQTSRPGNRQPEAPKARPVPKAKSNPEGTFQGRGQEMPSITSYPQRPSRDINQPRGFMGVYPKVRLQNNGSEPPFGSVHSPTPPMDARSLSSKVKLHPACSPLAPPRIQLAETASSGTLQNRGTQGPGRSYPQHWPQVFVGAHAKIGKGSQESPFGYAHSPRPAVDARLASKENIYRAYSPLSPAPKQRAGLDASTATFQSQKPGGSHPQRSSQNTKQPRGFMDVDPRIGPRRGGLDSPTPAKDTKSLSSKEAVHPAYSHPPYPPPPRRDYPRQDSCKASVRVQDTSVESLHADDSPMMQRLKLMEEGRAGYDEEDVIQDKGAQGLTVHDIESISDVSSIDMSESEDEESDAPTTSSTPIAFKYIQNVDFKSPRNSRSVSGILRGAGTRPNTPRERSVQFRNSPEVRYI
ncbi:hypothetical protein M413DRAFT_10558 [Hebeloma cylindrosporum]|uniref:Uncharacterized protein n=1 Tax=Hebeloma cylindrosporum TaxID=76867 RepID=A0A0C3CFN3_HEBCY|nr:hypothetical protein M413DRAFT_10558 [Hebeloma cylindrosporum h7]